MEAVVHQSSRSPARPLEAHAESKPAPIRPACAAAISREEQGMPRQAHYASIAAASVGFVFGSATRPNTKSRGKVKARATATMDKPVATAETSGPAVASEVVKLLWQDTGFPRRGDPMEKQAVWARAFADDCIIEDTYFAQESLTSGALKAGLVKYLENKANVGTFVVDEISDGREACGFMWHLEAAGTEGQGLRGTTFVGLNDAGKIDYLREIAEPLFKPGDSTVKFLEAVGGDSVAQPDKGGYTVRTPVGAKDVTEYLWKDINMSGGDIEESLRMYDEDCLYEDFNYEEPLRGKPEIRDFLEKFTNIKSLQFVPERFSDGQRACCFTWHVEIAGVPADAPQIRGISFYRLNDAGLISFVRDIPESAIKPPPLQALAAAIRPDLRVFSPRVEKASSLIADQECGCSADGVATVVGARIDAAKVLGVRVANVDGELKTLGEHLGGGAPWPFQNNAPPNQVVIFLRHLA